MNFSRKYVFIYPCVLLICIATFIFVEINRRFVVTKLAKLSDEFVIYHLSGNCYGNRWTAENGLESRSTFAAIIHEEAGYETFYAGKYLNNYHGKAVPNGWDHWYGLIGNSR